MHHLLKQDFVEFDIDEYVGYELDDPEMYNHHGTATYIYATVIEKLPVCLTQTVRCPQIDLDISHLTITNLQVECAKYDRATQQFFDRYRINIGHDVPPIIVSSLDLYRLHRVIERKPKPRRGSASRYRYYGYYCYSDSII